MSVQLESPTTIPTSPRVAPESENGPPETIRVLHVINGEYFSGAERVQDLLALGLPKEGFSVGFACVKPDRFARSRVSRVPLFETPMRGRFDLTAAWRIAGIVRREGYSLLHAHTPRSALVGGIAARLSGVPLVYHLHSPTSRDSTRRLQNWLNTATERFSLGSAAAVVTVSRSLGSHMRERGYDDELVRVVPNGVPVPGIARGDRLPGPEWTIGAVALFRPRKGLETLLSALRELRASNFPVRLRAVGPFESPEYERSIRSAVAADSLDEFIDWIGFTDDVPAELARLDLFVLPSLFGEGLPMVVLEAMAGGVPVLATRVEGVPEAIEHGKSGLLAEPRDAAALASRIKELVQGDYDWNAIRCAALRRHRERFSDQAMAAGVAGVYRKLLV